MTKIKVQGIGLPRRLLEVDTTFDIGAWAVHRQIDRSDLWCITYVPMGLCLPLPWASFERESDAIAAAREIHAMRNDWHSITQDTLSSPPTGQRLRDICAAHNAAEGPYGGAVPLDRNLYGRETSGRLNGFLKPGEYA